MVVVRACGFEAFGILFLFEAIFPEFGHAEGEVDICLGDFPSRIDLVELFIDHIGAPNHASLLFDQDGFLLILHHVAVALGLFPATAFHGRGSGGIFAAFDGGEIGGILFGNFAINLDGLIGEVHEEIQFPEFVHGLAVLWVRFDDGLEGEGGDFDESGSFSGFFEEMIDLGVSGIGFEAFLGELHGCLGVFLDDALSAQGCGGHAGEEVLFSFGGEDRYFTEEFSAIEKARVLFEDGLEESDRIAMIAQFDGTSRFEVKVTSTFGEFFFSLNGHKLGVRSEDEGNRWSLF